MYTTVPVRPQPAVGNEKRRGTVCHGGMGASVTMPVCFSNRVACRMRRPSLCAGRRALWLAGRLVERPRSTRSSASTINAPASPRASSAQRVTAHQPTANAHAWLLRFLSGIIVDTDCTQSPCRGLGVEYIPWQILPRDSRARLCSPVSCSAASVPRLAAPNRRRQRHGRFLPSRSACLLAGCRLYLARGLPLRR